MGCGSGCVCGEKVDEAFVVVLLKSLGDSLLWDSEGRQGVVNTLQELFRVHLFFAVLNVLCDRIQILHQLVVVD